MNYLVVTSEASTFGYAGIRIIEHPVCERHLAKSNNLQIVGYTMDTCNHCSVEWYDSWKSLITMNGWLRQIGPDMTVYISGPMSDLPNHNHLAFALMEHALKWRGADALNPCHHDVPDVPYHILLRMAIKKLVDSATHVVMLNGWQHSGGATKEHELAGWLCLPIFYEIVEPLNTGHSIISSTATSTVKASVDA